MAQVKEYLTFDDVLLKPQASTILPNNVDISTNLTKVLYLLLDLLKYRRYSGELLKLGVLIKRRQMLNIL